MLIRCGWLFFHARLCTCFVGNVAKQANSTSYIHSQEALRHRSLLLPSKHYSYFERLYMHF